MGLESHIRQVLEDDPVVMAFGLDYWFENGLKVSTQEVANKMVKIFNDSGEFGHATALYSLFDREWTIEFGVHPQFKRK
jgi:hypothetical protein